MKQLQQTLSTGTITINTNNKKWSPEELFSFAERQNPKRSFLFVSKVLGKHIPVSPSIMRSTYQDLANLLPENISGPILFIGMAETAVGLAGGVFEEAIKKYPQSLLLTTTRHPIDGKLLCEFKEEHSHATDHLIYWPKSAEDIELVTNSKTLILVDDEATTGNTFNNLILSLKQSGLTQFTQIITVTLTDWTDQCLSNNSLLNSTPIKQVSLIEGNWCWQANPNANLPVMPDVNVTKKGIAEISHRQDWGRLGMKTIKPKQWASSFHAVQNERILVLGTGEFTYVPFLLAEYLEKLGAKVLFSSTTRSPIANGLAIESTLAFTDNYGLNIPNFCYNVAHQKFDRIIVCIETNESDLDPRFIKSLELITETLEVESYA